MQTVHLEAVNVGSGVDGSGVPGCGIRSGWFWGTPMWDQEWMVLGYPDVGSGVDGSGVPRWLTEWSVNHQGLNSGTRVQIQPRSLICLCFPLCHFFYIYIFLHVFFYM